MDLITQSRQLAGRPWDNSRPRKYKFVEMSEDKAVINFSRCEPFLSSRLLYTVTENWGTLSRNWKIYYSL